VNILITGGAGFIGSNIARSLCKTNKVRIVDNLLTGRLSNLDGCKEEVEFIECDIRDAKALTQAMKGIDYVLHQAALPSVPRSVAEPGASNDINITGTLNVLIAARDSGVKRVVYAASSSAYGDTPTLPKNESMTPNPLSPYAVTKLTGEYYCKVFHKVYGLETVSLRYFNVFGPRQDPKSQYAAVIPRFIMSIAEGKPPTVYGDGEQTRDFTFVENVIDANVLAMTAKGAAGEVFNIACGERFSLNNLVERLNGIMETDLEPIYEKTRTGDIKHSLADISKASKILRYKPRLGFGEGLKKTVDWFTKKQ